MNGLEVSVKPPGTFRVAVLGESAVFGIVDHLERIAPMQRAALFVDTVHLSPEGNRRIAQTGQRP